jgi:hypothetical protein
VRLLAVLYADIERRIAAAGLESTIIRPGGSAFITSTVFDILGSAPRSFREWVADHATAFR